MALLGIGVDMILISRIDRAVQKYGSRFLDRIFHPTEQDIAQQRVNNMEYLAGCFAVKEAALKALGDFPGKGIAWRNIYITHESTGKPILHFEERALALCRNKGIKNSHVSITHDGDMAIAYVILEN